MAHIQFQALKRGQIISAFSQCEFLTQHIAIRCRILQEYWSLKLGFHKKLDRRLKQAEELFLYEGPLHKYSDRVIPLINELREFIDIRDFMAHAFCKIRTSENLARYDYQLLRRTEGSTDEIDRGHLLLSKNEIASAEQHLTSLAQRFIVLFSEIYHNEELELWDSLN